jgi:hypothetical protein
MVGAGGVRAVYRLEAPGTFALRSVYRIEADRISSEE